MPYTEFSVVEKPIVEWLQRLGWKYVSSDELKRDLEEPFDIQHLRESIKRLNSDLLEEDVDKIINELRRVSNDISGNRQFLEWLKGETSLVLKAGEKARTIRLIDFQDAGSNEFIVTNQFKFSGYDNVKFDIILFVNGIPLVVIEAKVPTRMLLDYHEAIKQIQRYARVAPQFFKYLAFACPTDGVDFKYGWITTEGNERFLEWRSQNATDPVEACVRGLFEKSTFLDIVGNFIVFEKDRERLTKKIAMQQQVIAANKIVDRVLEGKRRTGLVWHTQGSGKTLTMLFAAWKLKRLNQLENPTILVIVDRVELENQLGTTFRNVDLPYTARAETTRDLMDKLKKDTREVLITTIQKFEDIKETLSKRKNIVVFIDEAHRTQYGKLGIRMRSAFPNAMIFGFTGTPIEKGPLGKSTFRTFCPSGEKYLDKYSIKQSIRDGATVPILYVARPIEYHVPSRILDEEFFKVTQGLEKEEDQDTVLQKSATLRNAFKSRDRIDKIAKDIADHFRSHVEPDGFKAQVVAVDREACALYKESLDKYLPKENSVVIYTAGQNDGELLRKYHMAKEDQLNIARNTFQKANENPKLLIVTDMLLTGFDAPIEQVMYLDKPMRDHKLLQAIARTNRPYPGKQAGIIIDYVPIFKNLQKALNFEEKDIEGVAIKFDELKREFKKVISSLSGIFDGVKRDDGRESLFSALSVLEDDKQLKQFKSKLSEVKKLYETIAPDSFLQDFIGEYGWLIEVNEAYNKVQNRQKTDLSEYQEKTKALIKEKLLIDRIEVALPTFEIDKHYLKAIDSEGYSTDQKIMDMKRALEHHIRINLETNPIYETLSQRLARILRAKNKSEILAELKTLVDEIAEIEEQTKRMGVTKEEFALFNVTKKYDSELPDQEMITFVKKLVKEVKTKTFQGWQRNRKVVKDVEGSVFDSCYQTFSSRMETAKVSSLTDEVMKFVMKYNA